MKKIIFGFVFMALIAVSTIFVTACGEKTDTTVVDITCPSGFAGTASDGKYACVSAPDAGIADASAVQPECAPGSVKACGSGVGECKLGLRYCGQSGYWSAYCLDAVAPTVEICDGKDNDCDGLTDEGEVCPSQPPDAGTADSGTPPPTWVELEVILPSAPAGYKFADLRSNLGCPNGDCWHEESTPPAIYNVACNKAEREFNVAYDPIGGGTRIYLCQFLTCDKEPVLRGLPYVRNKATGKSLKVNCRLDSSQSDPAKGKYTGDIYFNPCE